MTPAARTALIADVVAKHPAHLRTLDDIQLAHEVERAESLPRSAVGDAFRMQAAAELVERAGIDRAIADLVAGVGR